MRALVVVSALLALGACSPNYREYSNKCEVPEAQMRKAFDEVSRMNPYSGKRIGRCDLIVDDAHNVSVITPQIRQSVEEMIAREKIEANQ